MKSFGPSASIKDGTVQVSCTSSKTYCFQLVGNKCLDFDPAREIENPSSTPDWCRYAQDIREELEAWIDFDRMGLTDMTRAELLKMMHEVPVSHRNHYQGKPVGLNAHNAGMMRHAIRRWRLAKGEVAA